jgi:hypothetical protein
MDEVKLLPCERKRLLAAWTDFLDANPDDVTSPEEYPDHALVTFEQIVAIIEATRPTLVTGQLDQGDLEVQRAFALEGADEMEMLGKRAASMLSVIPAIVAEERLEQHNAVYETEAKRWFRLAAAIRALAHPQPGPSK